MTDVRFNCRLDDSNLDMYISQVYGNIKPVAKKILSGFKPVIQSQFGAVRDGDCTLCAITAVAAYKFKYTKPTSEIYGRVRSIASSKKIYRDGLGGTIPFLIKFLIDRSFNTTSHSKYLKNVGFNWGLIKTNINQKRPMILSIVNDGRNFYKSHSIEVVGYIEYEKGVKILAIFDNWYNTISYIDYNKMHSACNMNYI